MSKPRTPSTGQPSAWGSTTSTLYLIHQPYGDVYGAWRAMEELHKEGRIRAIGVSNFYPDRVMDFLMHQQVPPAVDQIETHPFHQQTEAHAFLEENNVQHQRGVRSPKAATTCSKTKR